MPWLDDGTPQSIVDALANTKKSLWPRDETNRSDARFRHLLGDGMPYPRPQRWVIRIIPDLGLPTVFLNGWLDLAAVSDTVLTGSTGMSAAGHQMDLDITSYADTTDPNFGFNGIEYRLTFLGIGGDTFWYAYMVPINETSFFYETIPLDWLWENDQFNQYEHSATNYVLGMQPEWLNNNLGHALGLFSVSECWVFPAPAGPGFASFNGTTSYIKNRSLTVDTMNSWRQEFDIRLNATDDCDYLAKSFNGIRVCRIGPNEISYIGRSVTFSTPLVVGTWYHIDFRFQWSVFDVTYRVSVDGGPDDLGPNSNRPAQWDQFGRRGTKASRGEYDFKNFVLTRGPDSSPLVFLDQKFQTDACDDGPDARDGDTFFMTLPSCP